MPRRTRGHGGGLPGGGPAASPRLPTPCIHGTTGLLLDGGEPGDVAAALRTLLADSSAARAMGAAGRARARERFSPERHAADMEAVYLEAIARRGRTS